MTSNRRGFFCTLFAAAAGVKAAVTGRIPDLTAPLKLDTTQFADQVGESIVLGPYTLEQFYSIMHLSGATQITSEVETVELSSELRESYLWRRFTAVAIIIRVEYGSEAATISGDVWRQERGAMYVDGIRRYYYRCIE